MRRGDFVTVAIPGDFGKPRPALVIQSDQFSESATVTILLVSRTLVDAPLLRVTVDPDASNGLRKPSQIQIDKTMSVRRERIGEVIGHLDDEVMLVVTRSLALFMGLA